MYINSQMVKKNFVPPFLNLGYGPVKDYVEDNFKVRVPPKRYPGIGAVIQLDQ